MSGETWGDGGFPLNNQHAFVEIIATKGKASKVKGTRTAGLRIKILKSSINEIGNSAWTDNYLSGKMFDKMKSMAKACKQPAPNEDWKYPVPEFNTSDLADKAFTDWVDGFKEAKLLVQVQFEVGGDNPNGGKYPDKNTIGDFAEPTEELLKKWDSKFKYTNEEEASSGGF